MRSLPSTLAEEICSVVEVGMHEFLPVSTRHERGEVQISMKKIPYLIVLESWSGAALCSGC